LADVSVLGVPALDQPPVICRETDSERSSSALNAADSASSLDGVLAANAPGVTGAEATAASKADCGLDAGKGKAEVSSASLASSWLAGRTRHS